MKIHRNDTVLVISGKDKDKKGKVLRAFPKAERVVVEKVNIIKRHTRARGVARQAGIIEREAPIQVDKLMYLCSKCGHPARVGFRFLEDGRKVRFCRTCREVIE